MRNVRGRRRFRPGSAPGSGVVGVALVAVAVVGAAVLAGCGSAAAEPVTADEYRRNLEAVCAATTADLDALPAPPEQITVIDFATLAAEALAGEAQRADRLDLPDDDTLRADHRAFVRNTLEQAEAWRAVAGGAPEDIGVSTDLVRGLVLGRNDLATEMGAPGCRRER